MRYNVRTAPGLLAVLAATCFASVAWAGPTGGQVVGGQAVIQSLSQETLIKQSTSKAIINWNAFSILSNESVVFQQPSAQSIALNRVLGGSPSSILGTLTANGQVWLVNPNGVLFGKTAIVNATGLLATTANIANSDFLNGNYNFGIPSANASAAIANYGTINTAGGSTVLVAPIVDNAGTIEARLGTVVLATGSTFAVDFDGDNLLNFAIATPASNGQINNLGTVAADGGTVELNARAAGNVVDNVINTGGIVQANSVSIKNGTVILDAGQGGSVNLSGTVSAAGTTAGTTGGTVKVLGSNVTLAPTASVNVSGQAGGGTADIGGDLHGAGPDPNAVNTNVAQGATITADALTAGNGGQVAVWSNQNTSFNGSISAQGGPQGGNGGFVETSSAADLSIGTGSVNTRALNGLMGSWLLDPANLYITANGSPPASDPNAGAVSASAIDSALATTNVTLTTSAGATTCVGVSCTAGSSSSQSGDITVSSEIAWSSGGTLTLSAYNNINIDAEILLTGAGGLILDINNAGTNSSAALNFALGSGSVQFTNEAAHPTLQIGSQGSDATYSLVFTTTELQNINNALTGTYALAQPLNATGVSSWTPIGAISTPFSGTFNGLGNTISNLTVYSTVGDSSDNFGIGLFAASSGTIQNIGLVNANVTGGSFDSVGALVGENTGAIGNAYVAGTISVGAATQAGGLVGYNNGGSISQSSANAAVTATDISSYVGGLVGQNTGTISQSWAGGTVTGGGGNGALAGGLVGLNNAGGTITDAYATGNVNGGGSLGTASGGLVGQNIGSITDAYATGAVTGGSDGLYVGGLVGENGGSIGYAYAAGAVTGSIVVGGLVGYSTGSITGGYWNEDRSPATGSTGIGYNNGSGSATGLTGSNVFTLSSYSGFTPSTSLSATGNAWVIVDVDGTLNNNAGAAAGGTMPMLASEYSTLIANGHQLQLMAMAPTASYTLARSIDASATGSSTDVWGSAGFIPVGGNGAGEFTGTFNGLGNTISNLTINDGTDQYVGLFGRIGSGGIVSNLGLVGSSVGGTANNANVGALAGFSQGMIDDAYATGAVSGGSSANSVGGLIGWNNGGTVENAYATGTVNGGNVGVAGGLVGWNESGTVENVYASATVTGGSGIWDGGLVGNNGGTIENAYATGTVTGGSDVGGLVGNNSGTVEYAYATGAATGGVNNGGLAGQNGGTFTKAYWDSDTNSTGGGGTEENTAGLEGSVVLSALNSSSLGTVWGNVGNQTTPYLLNLTSNPQTVFVAGTTLATTPYSLLFTMAQVQAINNGLSGFYALANSLNAATDPTTPTSWSPIGESTAFTGTFNGLGNTISNLTINSTDNYVGLFGQIGSGGIIENIGLIGDSVTGTAARAYVGGLVGYNDYGMIEGAYATGSVKGTGGDGSIGGLVGWNNYGTIEDAYATGSVTGASVGGSESIGGLVGWTNGGTIENVYAMASVSSDGSYIGGLLGYNNGGTVEYAYAAGPVVSTGGGYFGGLIGYVNGGTVTDGYYDADTTGQTYDSPVGLHTSDLQAALPTGFSNTVWGIIPGVSYPYLLSFNPTTPQVVSGTVAGNTGGTTVAGAANGTAFSSAVTTGANGYYYFLLPAGTVPNGGYVLTYLPSGSANAVSAMTAATDNNSNATTIAAGVNLTGNTVNLFGNGTDTIAISALGTAAGSLSGGILYGLSGGTVTFNSGIAFNAQNTNAAQSANATITVDDAIVASGGGIVTIGLAGSTATVTLDDNITTAGGAVTLNGSSVLGTNVTVDTTAGGTNAGANIAFNGTVDGTSPDAQSLILLANRTSLTDLETETATTTPYTDGGTVTLAADILDNTSVNEVLITGKKISIGGDISADGQVVFFANQLVLTGTNQQITSVGNKVNLFYANNIDGTTPGAQSLTLGSPSDIVLPTVGASVPLDALTVSGPTELHGNVTTEGAIDLADGATTYVGLTIDSTGGGATSGANIGVGGNLEPGNSGALTLNAGTSGTVTLSGDVGANPVNGNYGDIGITGGEIKLGGDISTHSGTVTFTGATVLTNSISIATNDIGANNGADITFAGTLDDASSLTHTLTLKAGSAGDITFDGRVGNGFTGSNDGTPLASIVIESADIVSLNIPEPAAPYYDGFNVGQFIVEAAGSLTGTTAGAATLSAPNTYISTVNRNGGSAGSVNIVTSGNVEVGDGILAFGTISGTTGGNGGNVTVISQSGSIALEDAPTSLAALSDSIIGTGANQIPSEIADGIAAFGANAESAGQTAGAGGTILLTAAGDIVLPYGANSSGGNAVYSGSTANGGAAGSITVDSTGGNVYVGAFPAGGSYSVHGAVNGNIVGIEAVGGNAGDTDSVAASGNGGTGGNVSVSGSQLFVTHIYTFGGSSMAGDPNNGSTYGDGGAAGNIGLTASATGGAAVTLYGLADGAPGSLLAFGGFIAATVVSDADGVPIMTGAVPGGLGGAISIGGTTGTSRDGVAALNGTSFIQLMANGNSTTLQNYQGGSTFEAISGGFVGTHSCCSDVVFNGPIEGTNAGAENLEIVSQGQLIMGGSIGDVTPLGSVDLSGYNVNLYGTSITTAGGAVSFSDFANLAGGWGGVVLDNNLAINTSANSTAGASVTFAGTLDDSALYTHTLTLTAGTGDIVFDGRVGYNNPIDIGACSDNVCSGVGAGIPLAGIVIESAGDIDIDTPLDPVIDGNTYLNNDGFNVGSFIVEGSGQQCSSATCAAGASGSLNAGGSYVSTWRSDGSAGNITIAVGGNVEVGYQVYADPSGSGNGGNGGNVTIVAGGTVQVGDQLGVGPAVSCYVACSSPGAIAEEGSYSISAVGYSTYNSGDTAGNGGNVFVQGTAINLPNGVLTAGGAAIQNASTPNAGNGGNVTLIATDGNVTTATPQVGNILGIVAAGGDSAGGEGGTGGTVNIEGQQIVLSRIYTLGGATALSNTADAGTAGSITLTATAPGGPAVLLYGNSDSPTVTPGFQVTLDALGGVVSAPTISGDTLTLNTGEGTVTGQGGNIIIQGGAGGQPLQGGAYVQLVNNSANVAFGGGPTVYLLTGGGSTTTPPSIQILGPIEGTTNGGEALRVRDVDANNVFGSVTVAGDIGDVAEPDYASLAGGSVNVGGYIATYQGNIYPTGVSSVTGESFSNDGDVFFNGPVNLANSLQVDAAGSITFGNKDPAPVNGAYTLTLIAGGDVTFDTGSTIGATLPPPVAVFVQGADLTLQAVTTNGPQTYIGPAATPSITLNGNLTDNAPYDIGLFGGNIDFNASNLQIKTAGTISTGNVVLDYTTLSGQSSSAVLNADSGNTGAGGLVWVNQNIPGYNGFSCPVLSCSSAPVQTLNAGTVNAADLDQNAHILLTTGDTTITGSGTFTVTPSIDAAPGQTASLTISDTGTGNVTLDGLVGGGNAVSNLTIQTLGNDSVAMVGVGSGGLGGVLSGGFLTINTNDLSFNLLNTQSAPITINAANTTLLTPFVTPINTTLGGGGADVTLNTNIGSSVGGLAVLAGTGGITVNGSIGVPGAVTLLGTGISLGGNVITTNSPIDIISAGNITLTNNLQIDSTGQLYDAGGPIVLVTENGGSIISDFANALSIYPGASPLVVAAPLGTSADPLGAVQVLTAGPIFMDNGLIETAGQPVTFGGAKIDGSSGPTINGNIVAYANLAIDTNANSLGAAINLGLPIDAGTAGAQGVSLNGGTAGLVTVGAPIGANTAIDNFYVSANQVLLDAGINSKGGILTFDAPVVLSSSYNGSQIVVDTNANGATGGSIAFNSTIDSQIPGVTGLFAQTGGSGSVSINSAIGRTTPIGDLTVTAGQVSLGANITTDDGKVEFDGPVTLDNSIVINTANGQAFSVPGGDVTFNGTVNAASSGVQSLTVDAGGEGCVNSCTFDPSPGSVAFNGDVGGISSLNTLLVRGGNISLQSVFTTGSQYYVANGVDSALGTVTLNGNLTAGSGVTPAANAPGSDIQFVAGTVDIANSGLTIVTNGRISGGEILVTGSLSGSGLSSLILNAAGGLLSADSFLGGLISIDGTVLLNSAFGSLSTTPDAYPVGYSSPCSAATCTEGYTQTTSGNQTVKADSYGTVSDNAHLILTGDTTLTINEADGSTGVIPTVDSLYASAPHNLTVNQYTASTPVLVYGTLGDAAPLASVTISAGSAAATVGSIGSPVVAGSTGAVSITGSGIMLGGNVSTTDGAVTVNGPVTLDGNLAIDTTINASDTGASIDFQGTIDGTTNEAGQQALRLNAGPTGTITLPDDLGDTTPLGTVALFAGGSGQSGDIDLQGNITTAGGKIILGGPTVLGSGGVTLSTVGADTSNGANVVFTANSSITGTDSEYPSLTVNAGTNGNVVVLGQLGNIDNGAEALGNVSLTGNHVDLSMPITTAGTIGDGGTGAVTLTGAVVLLNAGEEGVIIDTTSNGASGAPITVYGTIDDQFTATQPLVLSAGAGAITIDGNVGSSVPLSNINISGAQIALNGGEIFTNNGSVQLDGSVVLGNSVVIDTTTVAGSGNFIEFGDSDTPTSIDDAAGQAGSYSLTLNAGYSAISAGTIGQSTPTGALNFTAGSNITLAGNVTTQDGYVFLNSDQIDIGSGASEKIKTGGGWFEADGAVLLSGNTTVETWGGSVAFDSTVDSNDEPVNLHLKAGSGSVYIDGDVGSNDPLGWVSIEGGGGIYLGANIYTDGDGVSFHSPVILTNNVTIDTTGDTNGDGSGVDSGLVSFHGTVDAQNAGNDSLTVFAGEDNIYIHHDFGDLGPLGNVALTGGSIYLGGNIYTAGGEVNFNSPVLLTASVTVDTTQNNTPAGAEINIWNGLDDNNAAGTDSLTLNAGNGSDSIIRVWYGGIGQTTPIGNFNATAIGNLIALYGNITTAGGAIQLNGPTQIYNSITLDTTAGGTAATGAGITFNGSVDANSAGGPSLTLTAGTGDIDLGNSAPVGGTTPLGAVTLTSANIELFSDITTHNGAITLNGPSLIFNGFTADTTGANGDGAAIIVNGTVNENCCAGQHQFVLNAGVDTVSLNGAVGNILPVGLVTLTGSAIDLNGGSVTTTGAQTYNGAVTIGANDTLSTTNSLVDFVGTVDNAVSGGPYSLAVSTGTGGVTFGSTVGASFPLLSLNITGTVSADTLDGNVTTTTTQTYGGPVTLGTDSDLTGSTVTFDSTVGGAHNLTVTGNGVFDDWVNIASLDVTGTGGLNGVSLTTTGTQTYGGAVTIGSSVVALNAQNVDFTSTVDDAVAGRDTLSVSGVTGITFGAAVGSIKPLKELQVWNAPTLLDGNVTTTYQQTYSGPVSIGANIVATSGNIIFFLGTLDDTAANAHSLTAIITGTGGAAFTTVGGTEELASLTVNGQTELTGNVTTGGDQTYGGAVTLGATPIVLKTSTGAVTFDSTVTGAGDALTVTGNGVFDGAVNIASLDVTGTSGLNGGSMTTSGTQSYGGAVTLGTDSDLTGTTVTFDAAVDGAHVLTLNASGAITALGAVDVGGFILQGGTWSQVAATLPAFAANDFELQGGTFVRALGGNGSAGSPYQITDVYGLQGVGTLLNDNFVVANNIDAGGTSGWNGGAGFVPIANENTESFTGSFNGQTNTISNLIISSSASAVGLFGTNAGTVSNVILTNATVSSSGNGAAAGTLVGVNTGTIANSSATGSVTGTASSGSGGGDAMLGGLVGYNNGGTINGGSFANVTVADNANYGDDSLGGLVGVNDNGGAIAQTYASGAITSYGGTIFNGVGGLVGTLNAGTVDQSFALGSVTNQNGGNEANLGGLVGVENGGSISNSYASGPVASVASGDSTFIGGLVGWQTGGSIASSYSIGLVQCNGCSQGGLIGVGGGTVDALSFWDIDSSDQATSAGGVGLTTAQAQSASYLEGLGWSFSGSSPWRINDGSSYPYLNWHGPTPLTEIVSGIAPDGSTVDLIVDGTNFGSTTAAANGAYQFLLTSGTTGAALVYLPAGTADAVSALTASGAAGLNLTTANAVYLTGQGSTVATSNLSTAEGGASGAGILYGVSGTTILLSNGTSLNVAGGTGGVLVDDALAASGGGAVSVNAVSIALAANITTAGGTITLTGPILLGGTAPVLTLDTTAQGNAAAGANIALNGTTDAQNGQGLTLNGGTGGNVTLGGDVGDNHPIASLSVSAATLNLGGEVTTTGEQTYGGAVGLGATSVLTTGVGAVTFDSTVTGAGDALTVDSTGGGNISFDGAVGSSGSPLGSVRLTTGGTTLLGGAMFAASLDASGATGAITLDSGVTTTGTQAYGGAVTLGADNNLTGSSVTFDSTVGGTHNLTVTGNGVFDGAVNVASLDVIGTSGLNGGSVTTTGSQSYGGAVTLGATPIVLTTQNNGAVTFEGTVAGANEALTVSTGGGNITFDGGIGAAGAGIGALTLTSTGTTTLSGSVYAANLDVGGASALGGNIVIFTDTADTGTGTDGAIAFGGNIAGGTNTLALNSGAGAITLNGVAAGALNLTATGAENINGGTYDIDGGSGTVSFNSTGGVNLGGTITLDNPTAFGASNSAVALTAQVVLTTSSNAVTFAGAVTGSDEGLTVDSTGGGDIEFASTVGSSGSPLGAVTLTTSGTTQLGGAVFAANLDASGVTGAITLDGGVTTTGTQSYGGALTLGANIFTAGGAVTVAGPVMLTGPNAVLKVNTTGQGDEPAGADITLGGTVDTQNGQGLNLNGGTGGTVTIDGVIGGNSSFGSVTISGANIDLNAQAVFPPLADINTAGQPVTIDGNLVFTANQAVSTNGGNIALNVTPGEASDIDPTLTLDAGSGAVTGTINLGQGYFLTLDAGSSNLTGTVNGVSGSAAAQFVTVLNNCAACVMNGSADQSSSPPSQTQASTANDGAAQTAAQANTSPVNPSSPTFANPPPTTTTTAPEAVVLVSQDAYEPPPPYQPNETDAPTTVEGIDTGASLFVTISPNASTDLTVSQPSTDQVVVAYANPPAVKPAANADPQRPQVVHPVAAYLDRMVTPTMPRAGVPGISFGYSLSGNSALW